MFNKPCGWRVYACKHAHTQYVRVLALGLNVCVLECVYVHIHPGGQFWLGGRVELFCLLVSTHILPLGGQQRNVAENGLIESGRRYLEFCAAVPYGANGTR